MIRTATIQDLEALASMEAVCFPVAEAATKEDIAARLQVFPNHFWLLFQDDTLVSFADGMTTDSPDLTDEMYEKADLHDEAGAWQMIFGFLTHPGFQRKGFATYLMKHVIAEVKQQNRKGLVLTCKTPLIQFYAKFGFIDEGISASVHGNAVWHQMRLTF